MMLYKINRTLLSINRPTLLYALVGVLPVVGFAPQLPSILVYLAAVLYAVFCISRSHDTDLLTLALLIYIPIELLITQPPGVFRSWPRYVLFALLLMNVSPLLQSTKLRHYREVIFQFMMWACAFLGVGSFFAYFLGVNFMKVGSADYILHSSLFGGLTTHSMMLGPIAGIGACYLANRAMMRGKAIDWIWVFISLFTVLLSASRSATMAAIAGVSVTIYYKSGAVSKFAKYVVVAIVILVSSSPLWEGAMEGVLEKNGSTSELNFDSRAALWDERVEEFASSPLVGVGFCAIDTDASYGLDISSGRVETGSSWLIVLSMLGIIGAFIIVPIIFRAIIYVRRRKDDLKAVLAGVLILFFVHMVAEGYIFAGGSFLAFMFWLTVGVSTDSKFKSKS